MSYKVQNDWNKNSKWHQTKKTEQKICTWKGARNLIIVPKIYCNAEYWRLAKTDVNGAKVQTTENNIQFDAWTRTGTNRCNAKTSRFVCIWYKFCFNKSWIFVAIYGIQKQKHVFPKNLKVKTLFQS